MIVSFVSASKRKDKNVEEIRVRREEDGNFSSNKINNENVECIPMEL